MTPDMFSLTSDFFDDERRESPRFLEISIDPKKDENGCIDGRNDLKTKKWSQMLGGSLHLVYLSFLSSNNANLDKSLIKDVFQKLKRKGYKVGVHRGEHKNEAVGSSDCGAADKLLLIIRMAVEKRTEIINRLRNWLEGLRMRDTQAYISLLSLCGLSTIKPETLINELNKVFAVLTKLDPSRVKLTGERLIAVAENEGANTQNLIKNHEEIAAFINLNPRKTFDTQTANKSRRSAFNLDLGIVVEEAKALGLDEKFSALVSLILYMATEMVLVENNPKHPGHQHGGVPLILHR